MIFQRWVDLVCLVADLVSDCYEYHAMSYGLLQDIKTHLTKPATCGWTDDYFHHTDTFTS